MYFTAFREDHDNVSKGRETFLTLTELFGKMTLAEAKLEAMDLKFANLGEQIRARCDGCPPKVTIIRFTDAKRAVVYVQNGTPQVALDAMGLSSGMDVENSRWGLAFKRIRKLGDIEEGKVLYIKPFDQADVLFEKPLWTAMPFVKLGDFGALPPLWTYGGPLSVEQIGEAIAKTLLKRGAFFLG